MTTELRIEAIAETACVAILRMARDAPERRAAAKRTAERFGFTVTENWTTAELEGIANEMGFSLEASC